MTHHLSVPEVERSSGEGVKLPPELLAGPVISTAAVKPSLADRTEGTDAPKKEAMASIPVEKLSKALESKTQHAPFFLNIRTPCLEPSFSIDSHSDDDCSLGSDFSEIQQPVDDSILPWRVIDSCVPCGRVDCRGKPVLAGRAGKLRRSKFLKLKIRRP